MQLDDCACDCRIGDSLGANWNVVHFCPTLLIQVEYDAVTSTHRTEYLSVRYMYSTTKTQQNCKDPWGKHAVHMHICLYVHMLDVIDEERMTVLVSSVCMQLNTQLSANI
jgi:hypothetical protein